MPGHSDPLSSVGLSAARIKELTKLLRHLHSADDDPDEALDALLAVSSLAQPDDASRTVLMGGSILEALADWICICDEEWISGDEAAADATTNNSAAVAPAPAPAQSTAAAPDDDPDAPDSGLGGDDDDEDRRLSLELCSRALNALGSLASFVPFVSSVLEEDRTDEAMEAEAFEPIAREINRAAAAAAAVQPASGATGVVSPASASSAPFRVRQFLPGSLLSFYPLLTACLFWLCSPRFRGLCQPQAAYALSWLLVLRPVALMMHEAGLASVLFGILREQQSSAVGRSSRAGTPDSTASGASSSERVSSSQENLRLFTLICLQRLSRTEGLRLFSDPLEPPAILDARLEVLLGLLGTVHSFNIRAIVLNVLLQAVTPPSMALTTPLPRRAAGAAAGSAVAAKPASDLVLPAAAIASLRDFRAHCGSIGSASSASSSRRTSPALGAIVAPVQRIPSATLGGAAQATATAPPARSWRAVAAPAPSSSSSSSASSSSAAAAPASVMTAAASSTAATPAPVASSAAAPSSSVAAAAAAASLSASVSASGSASAPSLDDDDVSELSRDPEAALDKTAHLQQLVDAILEQASKYNAEAQTR